MTSQRFCITEYLLRRHVHSTADEIFQAINKSDPRASRATVLQQRVLERVEWFEAAKAAHASPGARKMRESEVVLRGTCENRMKENSHAR